MDTGGKIATGILVPLAVVGAAVGAYILIISNVRGQFKKGRDKHAYPEPTAAVLQKVDKMLNDAFSGGKRRRTHRRRR